MSILGIDRLFAFKSSWFRIHPGATAGIWFKMSKQARIFNWIEAFGDQLYAYVNEPGHLFF
jgi:hypothetical protein